jgi:hypothetical protein
MSLHKQGDGVSIADKEYNDSSFLFSTNEFLSFFISKVNTKEIFVEKLQRRSRKRL